MRILPGFILIAITLIVIDAAALKTLAANSPIDIRLARLASMSAALVAIWLLSKLIHLPPLTGQSGLRPLVFVAILLNYATFLALVSRTPQVQPFIHLTGAWVAMLLFFALGLWRIGRWRN